jgi:hypothetical protein
MLAAGQSTERHLPTALLLVGHATVLPTERHKASALVVARHLARLLPKRQHQATLLPPARYLLTTLLAARQLETELPPARHLHTRRRCLQPRGLEKVRQRCWQPRGLGKERRPTAEAPPTTNPDRCWATPTAAPHPSQLLQSAPRQELHQGAQRLR